MLNGETPLYGGELLYTINLKGTELSNAYIKLENAHLSTLLTQGVQLPVAELT